MDVRCHLDPRQLQELRPSPGDRRVDQAEAAEGPGLEVDAGGVAVGEDRPFFGEDLAVGETWLDCHSERSEESLIWPFRLPYPT